MSGTRHPDMWEVVAPACAAASLGVLASILVALRQIHPSLEFEFDLRSVTAGLVMAGAGWALGRGLWRLGRDDKGLRRVLRGRVVSGLIVVGALVLAGFVVASIGIPESRRRDMLAGAALAVLVLSVVGGMLWKLARLFGRPDDPET